MGSLYGYFGTPAPGLLHKMGELLAHRHAGLTEELSLSLEPGLSFEVGRGIPKWGRDKPTRIHRYAHGAFVHSGVLYRYPGDPPPLERLGYLLCAPTDPKIIEDSLAGIEGVFVAACVAREKLFLVRDHAGVKALYWTRNRERLLFASEVKALFADPLVERAMRPGALPEYLTFSFVPGAGTMFENVQELQPGHILSYSGAEPRVRRHFHFEQLENLREEAPIEHYAEELRAELDRGVKALAAEMDVPPAVFLSGGIDSSAVLALAAQEYPPGLLNTFSIDFGSQYAHEMEFVSMMTDRYRTTHHRLVITPAAFMNRMTEIVWRLDEPIGDPITVPNYLMSEAASHVSGFALNGEGGDPCFGGPKNIPMMLAQLYGPLDDTPNAWLEREYLHSFRKCYADLREMLDPDFLRSTGGEEALADVITPFLKNEPPVSFVNKLMAMNIRLKGANLILVKVDKMSSANGVLALPLLFSKRIVETAMRCPPWTKLAGNIEKAVLKKAVEDIVPKPIIDRPKSGMMVPVRFWFRGEMRRYASRVLSKRNLRNIEFLNTKYVRKLLDYELEDVHGMRYGLKLWMLITFLLWRDLMLEGPGGSKEPESLLDAPWWKRLLSGNEQRLSG